MPAMWVACHGVKGHWYQQSGETQCAGISPFGGGQHYLCHSLASDQTTGRDHSPTHQLKTGLTIYWVWLLLPEQDPVFLQPVPPIRKFAHASYPHSSEGRQNENQNQRKLTKTITWVTDLCNLMKLWAMACRVTQDEQVMVERSDRMWSTGERNGEPLYYSCLENPMNSMKRQKGMTLKDEFLRSVGAEYATGDQWRNNSRKNEGI